MNKNEIIEKLNALLQLNPLDIQKEVRILEKEYKKIWTEEFEKAKLLFTDEGGKAKDFHYERSAEDNTIIEIIAKIEKNKEKSEKELDILREDNKRKKEDLLSQLEVISEADVNNIAAVVKKIREIQNQWKELKELKKTDYAELQRRYNTIIDKINENIKAFDILQQYDFQKNTEKKEELLVKIEELLTNDDPKKVDELLKLYKKEWHEIGNVTPEKYNDVRTKFNDVTLQLKNKLDIYYQSLTEEREANLNLKKNLISLLTQLIDPIKNGDKNIHFKNIDTKIQELKEQWKNIGHIPSEHIKDINQEFNQILDIFYDAKRKYQEELKLKQNDIRTFKNNLIKKVEELKQKGDSDKTRKEIINAQQEWKKSYLINKEENEQLNNIFKKHCDDFFEGKRAQQKQAIQQEKDNLVKKINLLNELKSQQFDASNADECIKKIQSYVKEWNSIGHVPIEEKDKVNDDFFGKVNGLYAELNLSTEKRTNIQFQSKIEQLLSAHNPIDALKKEETFIKKQLKDFESKLHQIENNLAFFKNAKQDNPLLKDALAGKEKEEKNLKEWQVKLNTIQRTIKELQKEKNTSSTN